MQANISLTRFWMMVFRVCQPKKLLQPNRQLWAGSETYNARADVGEWGTKWPLPNFQGALVDGVERYLDRSDPLTFARPFSGHSLAEDAPLYYEAPQVSVQDQEPTTEPLGHLFESPEDDVAMFEKIEADLMAAWIRADPSFNDAFSTSPTTVRFP